MKNRRAAILFRLELLWDRNPDLNLRDLLRSLGDGRGLPSDKVLVKKLAGIARGWDRE